MNGKIKYLAVFLAMALLLSGCTMKTVDQMYAVPRRSSAYQELQLAIDGVMGDMSYCAPLSGDNQQTVQMADLNGDGEDEYLLFARGNAEAPLKIFVFLRQNRDYILWHTIEGRGSGFEQVEYVQIDGKPGRELVVGRQLSDQVVRNLAVYSFSGDKCELLMTAGYTKFVTTDLDQDSLTDLLVIAPGDQEEDNAVATLYRFREGSLARSREARLSEHADNIKRIMVSRLYGGVPAVYVASAVNESAIITDVFSLKEERFTNISLSSESGTSVQTLRNHYVYAVDIDDDGMLELPSLIDMVPVQNHAGGSSQYLIRWYTLTPDGGEVDRLYTFHNFQSGWYLKLDEEWAPRVSVTEAGGVCTFYVWDTRFEKAEKLLTIYTLTGSDRQTLAEQEGRIILYKTDGAIYAAVLEVGALSYGLTAEHLPDSFFPIHMDWKSGET